MKDYHIDYIKEKAKANYELIKVFSLLFVTIAVGTVSELKTIALQLNTNDISAVRAVLVTSGFISLFVILSLIVYYVVNTNRLLSKINDSP